MLYGRFIYLNFKLLSSFVFARHEAIHDGRFSTTNN